LALQTIDFEKEKTYIDNYLITIVMVKLLWYWESYGQIRKKKKKKKRRWGKGRADSLFSLELGHFSKGIHSDL
jgi:hypothetical protein